MALIESAKRWAFLVGLLGMAAGSLVLQACTRASPGGRDGSVDAAPPQDAAVDATPPQDAEPPRDAETLDAQLWDVICE